MDSANVSGNNIVKTVMLIVGEIAGAGILSLPATLDKTGPIAGIIILAGLVVLCSATGLLLGKCFQMTLESSAVPELVSESVQYRREQDQPLLSAASKTVGSPEEGTKTQDEEFAQFPYVHIGWKACGWVGAISVLTIQFFALVGVGIGFIILCSLNLNTIWPDQSPEFWMGMAALVITPLSWLESPKDFWQAAVVALTTTVTVTIGALVLSVTEKPAEFPGESDVTFSTFFSGLGVILFAFGGHAIFPTLQIDMKDPKKFKMAVILAYIGIAILYIPLSGLAYYSFGKTILSNVLRNFTGSSRNVFIGIITVHLMFAVIIIQNPVSQMLDYGFSKIVKMPKGFNIWRVILRTVQVGVCLAIAEAVPAANFLCVFSMVGALTTPALAFIFPTVFYLMLKYKKSRSTGEPVKLWEWIVYLIICAFGMFATVACTKSSLENDCINF